MRGARLLKLDVPLLTGVASDSASAGITAQLTLVAALW